MLADAEPVVVVSVAAHGGYSFADVLPRIIPHRARVSFFLAHDRIDPGWRVMPHRAAALDGAIAAILYTSGTTGLQKGVLVKHVREVGRAFLAETFALEADGPQRF